MKLCPRITERWKLWFLLPPLGVLGYFLPQLIQGSAIVSKDTTNLVYVLRRWHFAHWWQEGARPLWNDGLFSGIYHGSNPQLGLFSPQSFWYWLFDGYAAHQAWILSLLMLSGLGMALYLKRLQMKAMPASVLGLCYALCGVMLSNVHNVSFMAGACVFPWILWSYEGLRSDRGLKNTVLLALFIAWGILEGDPVGSLVMAGCVLLMGSWTSFREKNRTGFLCGASLLMALLLTAVVLLPPIEAISETRRAAGIPFEQASAWSFAPAQSLQWLLPAYWGRYFDGTFWGYHLLGSEQTHSARFWMDSIYLSFPLLGLLFLGIFAALRPDEGGRRKLWPLLFAGGFLLISFGSHFFLHGLLFDFIPGYSRLRYPAKFLTYANLFFFTLIAFGYRWLQKEGMRITRFLLAVALAYLFIGALAWLLKPDSIAPLVGNHASVESIGDMEALLNRNIYAALGFGLCCLLVLLWMRLRPERLTHQRLSWLILGVGVLDLLLWTAPVQTQPLTLVDQGSRLEQRLKKDSRILWDASLTRFQAKQVSISSRETLAHNWALLEGPGYVFGYEPTMPQRFQSLLNKNFLRDFKTWLRVLRIDYVFTPRSPSAPGFSALIRQGTLRLQEVCEEENLLVLTPTRPSPHVEWFGEWKEAKSPDEALAQIRTTDHNAWIPVIEIQEALLEGRRIEKPGIGLLPQAEARSKGSPLRLANKTHNDRRILVKKREGSAGILLIRDNYHPGWHAFADGEQRPIFRANYLHMAVPVRGGEREINLRFQPWSATWGAWISIISWAAVLLLFPLRWLWHRRRTTAANSG